MALLINPRNPNADAQSKNLQTAAQRLGLQLHVLNASTQGDLDPAFARVHELKANALMIAQDVLFNTQTGKLADLSIRYAIPAIYPNRDFAEAGGLMSYGTDLRDAAMSTSTLLVRRSNTSGSTPMQPRSRQDGQSCCSPV